MIVVAAQGVNVLRTALITDRGYLRHVAGRRHPECPERLAVLLDMVAGLRRPDLQLLAPREATRDELALVHHPDYIDFIARTASLEHFDFDPDTHSSRETYHTALLASGGVLTAVEAVLQGAADNSFALVRPPGHHALPNRAMGFCFFNSIAIAAEWLRQKRGFRRILILDWDVHHGNGTQEMFYESPDVLYISTHQYPHYPGTGSLQEIGAGAGEGFTVNIPMFAELGDAEYANVFDQLIFPIARQFRPEFILVSCGFDAHYRDPLAQMNVTEDGFVGLCRRAKRLAAELCGGKLALVLEGGYDLEALVNSTRAVIDELGRDPADPIIGARDADLASPIIERVLHGVGRWWNLA
ncbi:MAG TPA: histone deacetylase [Candidatus Binataceae bacterium]|nr:histone deacetylase [Candidatus Binataceae bacterium]